MNFPLVCLAIILAGLLHVCECCRYYRKGYEEGYANGHDDGVKEQVAE